MHLRSERARNFEREPGGCDIANSADDSLSSVCVHQLIERQCRQTPSATAVACQNGSLTYLELDRRSSRLAARLRSAGVRAEVLTGVLLDRSADLVVAILAVLKAGGAYVPLDPSYPKARLDFMMKDSGAAVLLTEEGLLAAAPSSNAATVLINGPNDSVADPPLNSGAGPENTAYVIYTSGSTGTPKGVQVPHRAVVNFLSSMRRVPGLTSSDRLLAVTTICFDIAGLELYLPLFAGARVIIAPASVLADGMALARMLDEWRITVMQATPATWRLLLDSGWRPAPGFKVLCGGEALTRELANRLLDTGVALWNLYGPTETTIWSAAHRVQRGEGPVPIGNAIENTQLYVLDENLRLATDGSMGELYIGGTGVATGYLNRPDLTKSRFLDDPFRSRGRMYRTGDLARTLPDGSIECLGRTDQQIKIRGFRVEPGEIEAALEAQPGVQEAAVIAREDSPGDQRLVAYVVARPAARDSREIRKALRERLPEHMVPSSYVFLEALPLTPNRKVDRRALPKPDAPAPVSLRCVPPRTDAEKRVAGIWETLLGVSEIGAEANFFDLGGHSLLLAQLQFRLHQQLGVEIPILNLLEHPTIAAIAALLSAAPQLDISRKCVVPLRVSGANPPLFIAPGGNFSAISCAALAAALGPSQPVYAFHARGLDGQEAPLDRVEDLAAEYIRGMLTVQAHGPYYIAGVCFGGPIAFEIARQLEARGEEVKTLALIQSPTPDSLRPTGLRSAAALSKPLFFASRIRQHLKRLRSLHARERASYVREKMALLVSAFKGSNVHRSLRKDLLEQVVERAAYSAITRYRPARVSARIVLIVAEGSLSCGEDDPRLRWARFTAGGATVRRLCAGSTGELMADPAVVEVGRILAGSIESCPAVIAGAGL